MQRSNLIFRLVLMAAALVVAATLLGGLMATYVGRPAQEAKILLPHEVQARLAEEGYEVETLRREGGLYTARLTDGRSLWLDAGTGREIAVPDRQGNALQNEELLQMLRQAGYREITVPRWRRGRFEAEATDRQGRRWRLQLDTYSGKVMERET